MIPIANLAALLSLASSSLALAINNDGNLNIPLVRRGVRSKSEDEWREYRDFVTAKFTPGSPSTRKSKRASRVDVPLTNLEFDTSYFAQVSIGTPGTSFNVILDTGSSDLWVASNQCQCTQSATFNPTSSSSLQTSQQTVDLQYGSGEAQGFLVEDTVAIGGFSVSKQEFVLAEQVSQGLLQGSLSGLLGLGFQSIAQTQAVPLIEALAQGNQLTAQEISFYLNRLIDEQSAPSEAPGGTFTIGGTNSSLFQGDIDFVDLPSNVQPSFWLLPVTAVGVQGTTLTVNSGTQSLAAIDTGTTLIGGPSNAVAEIYSKIPGSQSLSGQMQGYFSVPCSTTIQTSFTFSSKTWPISPEDFTVQQLQGNQCLGALFGLDLGSQGGPDWVIGDTFLKNVYSVFRFSPGPSVGFAELASNLQGSSAASTPESTHTGSLPGDPLPSSSGSSPFGSGGNNPFTDSGAAASLRVGLGSTLGLISLALLSGILVL